MSSLTASLLTALVIRPGATQFDQQGRIQGSLDLKLTKEGIAQNGETLSQIQELELGLDVIYTSPSEPSLSSALQIGKGLGVPVKELTGLYNVHQGLWQGMELAELKRCNPRVFRQWEDSPESVCPPEGEDADEVTRRTFHALKKPIRKGGTFAIVVSEPLASLVASILRDEDPQLPGPVCAGGKTKGKRFEVITHRPAQRLADSSALLAVTANSASISPAIPPASPPTQAK